MAADSDKLVRRYSAITEALTDGSRCRGKERLRRSCNVNIEARTPYGAQFDVTYEVPSAVSKMTAACPSAWAEGLGPRHDTVRVCGPHRQSLKGSSPDTTGVGLRRRISEGPSRPHSLALSELGCRSSEVKAPRLCMTSRWCAPTFIPVQRVEEGSLGFCLRTWRYVCKGPCDCSQKSRSSRLMTFSKHKRSCYGSTRSTGYEGTRSLSRDYLSPRVSPRRRSPAFPIEVKPLF